MAIRESLLTIMWDIMSLGNPTRKIINILLAQMGIYFKSLLTFTILHQATMNNGCNPIKIIL